MTLLKAITHFILFMLSFNICAAVIDVGDNVEVDGDYDSRKREISIRTVQEISGDNYYMTDGSVFSRSLIHPLYQSIGSVSVGDTIYLGFPFFEYITIKAISFHMLHTTDGRAVHKSRISCLALTNLGPFSVGQKVEVIDGDQILIRTIGDLLPDSDYFLMSDGIKFLKKSIHSLEVRNCSN